MRKSTKKPKPLNLEKEIYNRAAKIAYHQAKNKDFSKSFDLTDWMDIDNDFTAGLEITAGKLDINH